MDGMTGSAITVITPARVIEELEAIARDQPSGRAVDPRVASAVTVSTGPAGAAVAVRPYGRRRARRLLALLARRRDP
jgi:hypothetical protein